MARNRARAARETEHLEVPGATSPASAPVVEDSEEHDSGLWYLDQLFARAEAGASAPVMPQLAASSGDAAPLVASVPLPAVTTRPVPDNEPHAVPARPRRIPGERRRWTSPLERRLLAVLLVLVLSSAALAIGVAEKAHQDAETAARAAQGFDAVTGPSIVVIGDASAPAASAADRWPALLQEDLSAQVRSLSSSGAAYVTAGAGGRSFEDEAGSVPKDADVVLFSGGAADLRVPSLQLVTAATRAFSAAAKRAPGARIVVMGPTIHGTASEAAVARLRTSLRVAASTAGVRWLDPIASGWLGASDAQVTSYSRVSSTGERAIARHLAVALSG